MKTKKTPTFGWFRLDLPRCGISIRPRRSNRLLPDPCPGAEQPPRPSRTSLPGKLASLRLGRSRVPTVILDPDPGLRYRLAPLSAFTVNTPLIGDGSCRSPGRVWRIHASGCCACTAWIRIRPPRPRLRRGSGLEGMTCWERLEKRGRQTAPRAPWPQGCVFGFLLSRGCADQGRPQHSPRSSTSCVGERKVLLIGGVRG